MAYPDASAPAGTNGGTDPGAGAASVADLLGTEPPASDPPAGGEDGGAGGGDQGGGEQHGPDPDWYEQVSPDVPEGEKASLRDFLKASNVKDISALAQRFRDTQRALHAGGKFTVPGEGASAEDVRTYHTAIGVPEDAKGYALDPIKDGNGNEIPLDSELIDRLAATALKAGTPKSAFQAMVTEYVQAQVEDMSLKDAAMKTEVAAKLKEWGGQANAKTAALGAGLEALGLDRQEAIALRYALGAGRAMEVFAKLGEGVAEDVMLHGERGERQRFGITGPQAQAQIDEMIHDPAIADKMRVPGTQEHARYERLQAIVGEHANRERATMQ